MLYAAEIMTDTGHIVIVDHNRKTLLSNVTALSIHVGLDSEAKSIGTVEADDCNRALDCVRRGDWKRGQVV